MANTKSAAKRGRQSIKRSTHNSSVLTGIKTLQKRFRSAVADGDSETVKKTYRDAVSALDKAAKRGIIHKNAANRRKSTFTRAVAAKA